jgi:hypothetical protein
MAIPAWLDAFTRIDLDLTGIEAPEVGRPYDETSRPKICLHTTEGSTIEGAETAFARYPPHIGVEYRRQLRHQYLPLDRCSFSLKGSESDDEFVVQVEIVGFAGNPPTGAEADWIGTEVIAPIARAIGCPLVTVPQGFHGPNEGITPYISSASSPIRFRSEAELRAFSGVFGHQHAPAPDTHWDPGAIDITRILAAARRALGPTPTPEEGPTMLIVTAPGRPPAVLTESEFVKMRDRDSLDGFRAAGLKTAPITAHDYDAFDRDVDQG